MLWFKNLLLVLVLVSLGACGFRPVYKRSSSGTAAHLMAAVEIEPINDRSGQILQNELLDLMTPRGRPAKPRYKLAANISDSLQELAVRKNAFSTRANLLMTVNYQLYDHQKGKTVLTGTTRVANSFDLLDSQYAAIVSEREARKNTLKQAAQNIRTRVAIFFQRQLDTEGK